MSTLRSLILLLVCAIIAVFVGVNWVEMNRPTELSLVFTEVQAPLGLVLLVLMAALAVAFAGVLSYMQGRALIEARRHARELSAQRELADKAEASRLAELRAHLDEEVRQLRDTIGNQGRETMSRIDRAEMGLRERPVDAEIGHLAKAVEQHNHDLLARVDRLEIGLRERPVDVELSRLSEAVENHNRDLHSRVDRLEMGLREGLAGYIPAPSSMYPAVPHDAPRPDQPADRT